MKHTHPNLKLSALDRRETAGRRAEDLNIDWGPLVAVAVIALLSGLLIGLALPH